jgi:hypothetical protein
MITAVLREKLRVRYQNLHPLLFHRSCEYAMTGGELFDILEAIPSLPVVWDQNKRRWIQPEKI